MLKELGKKTLPEGDVPCSHKLIVHWSRTVSNEETTAFVPQIALSVWFWCDFGGSGDFVFGTGIREIFFGDALAATN